jgi:serine/threonine-protein kinase
MKRSNPTLIADEPALPTTPPEVLPTPTAEAPAALAAGQRLGDYRLEACIGQGASASVWRATDVRLHMPIALKLFTPHGRAGRALLRGVMREARAASRVVSDHVIRVKDAGWLEDRHLGFIAMELCADYPDVRDLPEGEDPKLTVGHTLEQRLPESIEACVRAVQQAALGVADAHREGVFHRDVKPANILVRPGSGRAQITDFGLTVAELGKRAGGSVRLPVAGRTRRVIQGTPDYMPPEAAHGLPVDLDPAKDRVLLTALDVYGLGATLYALLAGAPPFRADPDAPDPISSLLEQVRESSPAPLTSGTRFRVPSSLRRIVDKAMHRDADARYTSARALADDLGAWLADLPTTLDGPHPTHRARLFARRHRAPLGAFLSVLVMLGAVATTAAVTFQLDQRVRDAEARVEEADAKRQAAKGLADAWESQAAAATQTAKDAERAKTAALERAAISQSDRDAARKRALALLQERDAAQAAAATAAESAAAAAAERDAAMQKAALSEAEALAARESASTARDERDAANVEAARAKVAAEAAATRAAQAEADAREAERRASTESALRRSAEAHAAELQRELEVARVKIDALERVTAQPAPAAQP